MADGAVNERTSHSALMRSAITWWESFRPLGWSLEQHLTMPHHRLLSGTEKRLADAVVTYIKLSRELS